MNLLKVKKFKKIKHILNHNDIFLLAKPYNNLNNFQSYLFNFKVYSYKFPLKQFKIFFKNRKILNCFNGNLSIFIFLNLNILINFCKNFKNLDNILPLIFFFEKRYISFNYLVNLLKFNDYKKISPLNSLYFLTFNRINFFISLKFGLNIFFIKKIKYILNDHN
jgi:hypothetical protein